MVVKCVCCDCFCALPGPFDALPKHWDRSPTILKGNCRPLVLWQHSADIAMEFRQSLKATADRLCFSSTLQVMRWKADSLQKQLKTACSSAVLCKYCDGRLTIHKSDCRNPDASAALCRHCDGRLTIYKSD